MLEFLQKIGYNPYAFIPGFTDSETGRMLQINGIFFKS
jgi:hypothetical protein